MANTFKNDFKQQINSIANAINDGINYEYCPDCGSSENIWPLEYWWLLAVLTFGSIPKLKPLKAIGGATPLLPPITTIPWILTALAANCGRANNDLPHKNINGNWRAVSNVCNLLRPAIHRTRIRRRAEWRNGEEMTWMV